MTENKRIAWNAVATYGRSVYAMLCGLFTSRWVLASLGEVDYGLVGVVGGLTMFISFLNSLMAESIVRFYAYSVGAAKVAKDPLSGLEECRKWFSIGVAIHTVLPLILVAVGYPCGLWAVENFLAIPPNRVAACVWVWRCVCLSCFMSMVSVPYNAMYTAKQEIAELTIYSFVSTTIYLPGVYLMTLSSRDWLVYYAVLTCALAVVPQVIVSVRAVIKYPECRFRFRYLREGANIRELLQYASVRFFGALSQLFTAQGIAIVVNKMLGPARNAALAIGQNLSSKSTTLTMSLRGALQPAITNATGAGDFNRANTLTFMTCLVSTVGVMVFAIPLAIEAPEVMVLWLKNPPEGSALLCQVLLVQIVIDQLTIGHVMRIFASGKIVAFQVAEAIVWIFALVIAWVWIARGGDVVGVGVGYLIMIAMDDVVKLWCGRACGLGIRYWFRRIFMPLALIGVCATAAGLLPAVFMERSVVRVLVTTGVVEVVLLPLVWFLAFGPEERQFMISRLGKHFRRGGGHGR